MTTRIVAAISLCAFLALIPFRAAALPDMKFPLQDASYCRALHYCTENVKTRGTKQWLDCITLHALRDPPGLQPGPLQNPHPPAVVLMDCGGVGWGNRFRAFQVSISLALISGVSVAYLDPPETNGGDTLLARMFSPPNGSTSWSHGVKLWSASQAPFEYAKTGFRHGPLGLWRDELIVKQMETWNETQKVLFAMTCGGVGDFLEGSACIKELLPPIDRCAIYHTLPNIPFYGATFSSGTPRLSALIGTIRERAGVAVSSSEERWPGANGLRAKDTFVLAFHYRRPSLKMEGGQVVPVADGWKDADNDENHHTWRSMLALAAEAKAEAVSRKQRFLLYFATDYEEFRPLVTRLLSNISTPVFGLRSEEVGHIVYGSNAQADFSFAEWWVLAQADWLVMMYPSAYSMTAAEVGFGTSGAMQRFDYMNSPFLRSQHAPECFGDVAPAASSEL